MTFNSPTEALLAMAAGATDLADAVWREWLMKNMEPIAFLLNKHKYRAGLIVIDCVRQFRDEFVLFGEEVVCRMIAELMLVAREKLADGHMLWQTPEWGVLVTMPLTKLWRPNNALDNDLCNNVSPGWVEEGITFGSSAWQDCLVRSFFRALCFVLLRKHNVVVTDEIFSVFTRLLDSRTLEEQVYKEVAALLAEAIFELGGFKMVQKMFDVVKRNEQYLLSIYEEPLSDRLFQYQLLFE